MTPGFVDIHTHYDGQVTWDPTLSPSGWHGVTTLVMGNCGVGFAPAAADRREWLIGLMEGVEEIPHAALAAGLRWEWETFPEYLDAIDATPKAVDVGAQIPHGPLRAFAMGERGIRNEAATSDEIARMAALVAEGIDAGALGVTTSRTVLHRGTTARRCRARSRPKTSCSRSAARWPTSAAACSRSRPRASRVKTCRRPTASSTGCAGSRRRPSGR